LLLDREEVKSLLTLVRIHVPPITGDPGSGVTSHVKPDLVWNYVIENHKNWRSKEVKLLYMTHRHLQDDTSLIVDAVSSDALADFLAKHIAPLDHVRGIWVLNLARMRFFKLSEERPRDFSRFTVTIDAVPKHMDRIYESISAFQPGRDVIVNYIAQTFQSFSASIMVSVLARSRNHMETFVEQYINPLKGVASLETTYISRTIRLVSPEEWQESIGPYITAPGGNRLDDIDADDDSLMAGC